MLLFQDRFEPLQDEPSDTPLIVHARALYADPRPLIVFIHGFGGSRYGSWGSFPQLVFDAFPTTAVGLYAYRTAFARIKFWRSTTFEMEAGVLAHTLRDIPYDHIFIVGHSLGGVLAQTALVGLLSTNQHTPISRIRGLALLASPQLGTWLIPKCLSWLTPDFLVLKRHSKLLLHNREMLDSWQVDTLEHRASNATHWCPTWAVLPDADWVVDAYSEAIGVPPSQVKRVRGTHVSISKPETTHSEVYEYLRSKISLTLLHGSNELSPSALRARGRTIEELNAMQVVSDGALTVGQVLQESRYYPISLARLSDAKPMEVTDLATRLQDPRASALLVGQSGCGKTFTLQQLVHLPEVRQFGVYWSPEDLRAYLDKDFELPPRVERLFLDGLEEAYPRADALKSARLKALLSDVPSVILTAQLRLLVRDDTRVLLSERFRDQVYVVKGVAGVNVAQAFRKRHALGQRDEPIPPLVLQMLSVANDSLEDGVPRSEAERNTLSYTLFFRSWVDQARPKTLYHYDFDACEHAWCAIAAGLHQRNTKAKPLARLEFFDSKHCPTNVLTCLLKTGHFATSEILGFIHPTFTDYYCALGIYRALVSRNQDAAAMSTLLPHPIRFEVTRHLRGLLASRLRGAPDQRRRCFDNLMSIVDTCAGQSDESYVLRSNCYYVLSRMPELDSHQLAILDKRSNTETHPLPHHTLLMNAHVRARTPMCDDFLRCMMSPKSTEDRAIYDANLYWHLHYYGDAESLELPQEGPRSWALTRQHLRTHLEDENHIAYWPIDTLTAVHLHRRYGGGDTDVDFMLTKLKEAILHGDSASPLARHARQVVQYVEEETLS